MAKNNSLYRACWAGHVDVVSELLDKSRDTIDVNQARTTDGATPLLQVCYRDPGHLEMVELLLRHGAWLHVKNKDGMTAREWAQRQGHQKLAAFLRQKEKEEPVKKAAPQTVRQWCRIFSASELFLAKATGEQKEGADAHSPSRVAMEESAVGSLRGARR